MNANGYSGNAGLGGIGGAGGPASFLCTGTLTAPSVSAVKPANGGIVTVSINALDVSSGTTILTSDGLAVGDAFTVTTSNVTGGTLLSGTASSNVLNLSTINFSSGNLNLIGGTTVGALNLTLPGALQAGGTAYPSPVTSALLTGTTVSITNSGQLQLQPGESAILLPGWVSGTLQSSTVTYGGITYRLSISGSGLVISRPVAAKPASALPKTGDSFPLGLVLAGVAVLAAGAAIVGFRLVKGRRRSNGQKGTGEFRPE